MELIKVKTKYQITLPASVRKQMKVNVGDIFEATVKKGEITLKAKNIIDKSIDEALAQVRAGQTYGPFQTHREMVSFLHEAAKKYKTKNKQKKL